MEIKFGKYKGKPVEDMLEDVAYCRWAIGEGAIKDKDVKALVCKHLLNELHFYRGHTYINLILMKADFCDKFHYKWYHKLRDYFYSSTDPLTDDDRHDCISCNNAMDTYLYKKNGGKCHDCNETPHYDHIACQYCDKHLDKHQSYYGTIYPYFVDMQCAKKLAPDHLIINIKNE